MAKEHHYSGKIEWTGNQGTGTDSYSSYSRDFEASVSGKSVLHGSSDPAFRGDATKYNPEDLLLLSLSSCHMLWYLHLCSEAGVVVTHYSDSPQGTMEENSKGGRFTKVVLHPEVKVLTPDMTEKAISLHSKAHELCFIANSVNFPVLVEPMHP